MTVERSSAGSVTTADSPGLEVVRLRRELDRVKGELAEARWKAEIREAELDLLHDLAARIGHALTFEELFRVLLAYVDRVVPCEVAAALVFTPQQTKFFSTAEAESILDQVREPLFEASHRLAGRRIDADAVSTIILGSQAELREEIGGAADWPICPIPNGTGDDAANATSHRAVNGARSRGDEAVAQTSPSDAQTSPTGAQGSEDPGGPDGPLRSFFQVQLPAVSASEHMSSIHGFLFVGARGERQFTENEVRLLYTMAEHAANVVQRLQDVLAIERRRLETILAAMPDGVLLLDCDGIIELTNNSASHFLPLLTDATAGERLEEFGGRPLAEIVEQSPVEIVPVSQPHLVVRVEAVRLSESNDDCWLIILSDATEQSNAIRHRDQFLAMLAHELRNPLASIALVGQMLARPEIDEADRVECGMALGAEVRHLTRMVDDLLDVSRYLHGKIRLVPESTDLRDILTKVARDVRSHVVAADHELRIDAPGEPVIVYADRVRLTQVIKNLVQNSIKYSPDPGPIDVRLRTVPTNRDERRDDGVRGDVAVGSVADAGEGAATMVELTVRDEGVGLRADQIETVFQPFVQTAQGIDRASGGLGLGLALSKMLIEMHRGEIWAESDGLGRGTTMRVRLPLSESSTAVVEPQEPNVAPTEQTVLVVEDVRTLRHLLTRTLQKEGFRVSSAAAGDEGLSRYLADRPDVAILDIGLPGIDGYELARRIREADLTPRPLLIALSGYAQPEDRRASAAAGFDEHFAKPADLPKLLEVVRAAKASRG